jgi:tRNA(fMet)-specific endonuclease VapC
MDELFATVEVLPFGAEEARLAARTRHSLEQAGSPIGPFDVLIAGHALSAGLVLVTNNTREFSRVKGLGIEDWLSQ